MAKSLRSKSKRSFRAKKREEGTYAIAHAARLKRLSEKLVNTKEREVERTEGDEEEETMQAPDVLQPDDAAGMDVDPSQTTKVSTHGPRTSRLVQWRTSKGKTVHAKSHGTNRQGGIAAKRKAGRPSRRR